MQSVSLCHGFQKSTESGSKQRFSLLQEKVVIQALCPRTQADSIKARYLGKIRKFQQPQTNMF